MSWKSLLHDNGHTLEDVQELFEEKTRWLNEEKEYVTVTDQLTKEKKKIPHGRAATHIQGDFPIKMFVMDEIRHESGTQLRLGYYIVSTDRLRTLAISCCRGDNIAHTPLLPILKRSSMTHAIEVSSDDYFADKVDLEPVFSVIYYTSLSVNPG